VFFDSGDRLSPDDHNEAVDTYEFDSVTGQIHLISSGEGSADELFMDASPDGSDVFFTTGERLSATDIDGDRDLYDARIDGDLAATPPLITPCVGEGCRGTATTTAPASSPPATTSFQGAGNLAPPMPGTTTTNEQPSRAQQLTKALRGCRSKHKGRKRKRCEAAARKRVGKVNAGGSK
jgi:hypothetical protein